MVRSRGLEVGTELCVEENPARDAGQWPSKELGGRKCTSANIRSERSSGGTPPGVVDWIPVGCRLVSSNMLSPQRLSPPRLLCGRMGSLCFGGFVMFSRRSKSPSSDDGPPSDESAGLLGGANTKLRRCLFGLVEAADPDGSLAVQKLRLRASVCAWQSSHSCTISRSHAESETKSSVKDAAIASFRLSRTLRREPLGVGSFRPPLLLPDCGERLGEVLWSAAMMSFTRFVSVNNLPPPRDRRWFSYGPLAGAVRCGAVRSEAVERFRRSSRRALARRPKHH